MVIITRFLEVIAAHLLGHEISAWFPKFAACLVRLAVNRLPERQRTRYLEEWQSHLEEIPGSIGKCVEALGFLLAAFQISGDWDRVRRSAAAAAIRFIDIVGSATALFILSPLLLFIAVMILIQTGRSPVLNLKDIAPREIMADREEWDALDGIFKFRVPFGHLGTELEPTRLGRFLIWTELINLPQFFSVLRGKMTLIGPALPRIPQDDGNPEIK